MSDEIKQASSSDTSFNDDVGSSVNENPENNNFYKEEKSSSTVSSVPNFSSFTSEEDSSKEESDTTVTGSMQPFDDIQDANDQRHTEVPDTTVTPQWDWGKWYEYPHIIGHLFRFFFLILCLVLLLITGGLLVICFMMSSGWMDKGGIVVWIFVSFLCVQTLYLIIFISFGQNRSFKSLKYRGICVIVELVLYFFIIEIIFIVLLPSSTIFSNTSGEVGGSNVHLYSEEGKNIQTQIPCNYSTHINEAHKYFGCSVDFTKVNYYFGGIPHYYNDTRSFTLNNNMFINRNLCLSKKNFIQNIAYIWQMQNDRWYGGNGPTKFFLWLSKQTPSYHVDYGGERVLKERYIHNTDFQQFNFDQQAEMFADYWALQSQGYVNSTYLSKFVEQALRDCV